MGFTPSQGGPGGRLQPMQGGPRNMQPRNQPGWKISLIRLGSDFRDLKTRSQNR